jgi:hypothetical protein
VVLTLVQVESHETPHKSGVLSRIRLYRIVRYNPPDSPVTSDSPVHATGLSDGTGQCRPAQIRAQHMPLPFNEGHEVKASEIFTSSRSNRYSHDTKNLKQSKLPIQHIGLFKHLATCLDNSSSRNGHLKLWTIHYLANPLLYRHYPELAASLCMDLPNLETTCRIFNLLSSMAAPSSTRALQPGSS